MKPVIEVDLDAIRANFRAFSSEVGVTVIPVVKAEAYGHGALAVAQAVVGAGARMLGVADAREATALRDSGIDVPILAWLNSPRQDWDATLAADLEIGVSSFDALARLGDSARERSNGPVPIHIKLDTGLGRNGVRESEWLGIFARAHELEGAGLIRVAGVMSHMAGAGEAADLEQIERFEHGAALADHVGLRPELLHLAATGAALRYPQARYDAVRLGIGLYGLSPFEAGEEPGIPLRPALALHGPIERDDAGWRIDVGTADGLAPVRGQLPPLVDDHGDRWRVVRVETNHCILEPLDGVVAGDRRILTLIDREQGRSATTDDWAAAAETINYEITTRLTTRLERKYLAPEPLQAADLVANSGEPRTAPLRESIVDLDILRAGLRAQEAPADLSADAYGHGVAEVLPLVIDEGLPVVATTLADLAALRELGARDATLDPDAGDETRAFYGLGGDTRLAAISLRSELIHVKRVMPGQTVSYGYTWRTPKHTSLGLVPIGYADAIPRAAFERAYVSVRGVTVPIVGRVAMDQVVIDLGDMDCWSGMPVHVWGAATGDVSLHDWAEWTGVRAEALCAALGSRVNRVYVSATMFQTNRGVEL